MPDNRTLHVGGVQYNIPPTRTPIWLASSTGTVLFSMDSAGVITTPGGVLLNSATLRTGFVPLPLTDWLLIAANDIPAIAIASGNGGKLASDAAPKLIRVNAATDKKLRIQWAASSNIEITQNFAYPADLDNTAPVIVNMLAASGGATNSPTMAVGYWENVGSADAGGNTAAITGTTLAQYTRSITVGAYPASASITLIPAAHTTDVLNVYSTWIEYTRK